MADVVGAHEPDVDLPPRRPDRRAQVGRRPGERRAHQRGGHDQRAERRAGARRAARGQHLHRRRHLRRGQASPRRRTTRSRPRRPTACRSSAPSSYCELFNRLHGLSTVSLRYGNVYGPRQDPLGEAGVIAIFCGKLLEGGTADDLRRRQADARLRLRGRRGGGEPARRRVATPPAPSTSASARRRRVLDIVEALQQHAPDGFERRARARAPRRGPAHRARPLARA